MLLKRILINYNTIILMTFACEVRSNLNNSPLSGPITALEDGPPIGV